VCPVLYQNYPNPFSSSTAISFNLATDLCRLPQIRIYNIKGQLIRSLECGESLSAKAPMYGDYSILWDGKDENGKQLSNGIYFYKLSIGNTVVDIKKCLLLQ
ncbi:MAG: hypothetical protein KAW92_02015, partial [Candidatus Cloacimonetes bacterium]|nr:hypothetical protein [Candidatus Cloacimonadota bacterium]